MSIFENPYVGLRAYTSEENLLFFGRDTQITELTDRLRENKFLAIIGTSGSGKSSLVRAGLMSKIEAGYLDEMYNTWDLMTITHGEDPFLNLREGLAKLPTMESINALECSKNELIDKIKDAYSGEDKALLILVDQFEEIFRYKKNSNRPNVEGDS